MLGDDGYPYGIPMNHWYCEEDGILYFHSAKEGHRMDAIRAYDKVSYVLTMRAGKSLGNGRSISGAWSSLGGCSW